jgi:hypothetical protein
MRSKQAKRRANPATDAADAELATIREALEGWNREDASADDDAPPWALSEGYAGHPKPELAYWVTDGDEIQARLRVVGTGAKSRLELWSGYGEGWKPTTAQQIISRVRPSATVRENPGSPNMVAKKKPTKPTKPTKATKRASAPKAARPSFDAAEFAKLSKADQRAVLEAVRRAKRGAPVVRSNPARSSGPQYELSELPAKTRRKLRQEYDDIFATAQALTKIGFQDMAGFANKSVIDAKQHLVRAIKELRPLLVELGEQRLA